MYINRGVVLRFLFWNTCNNKTINPSIVDMVIENDIDFVSLSEYSDDVYKLCEALSKRKNRKYFVISTINKRITILSSIPHIEPGYHSDYCVSQLINGNLIVVSVHLPSKIHASEQKRSAIARDIVKEIEIMEEKVNSDSTIIIGDLNSNPYEYTCLAADTFHGMPGYDVSAKGFRQISNRKYRMFYNPMWRFWGKEELPYGTYYYASNEMESTCWYILDQVLMRPSLMDRFISESLNILTTVNNSSLLNRNGHPNSEYSDHLPITFELEVE